MKIVIDAYNLALLEGTGISTYARELSKILSNNNHEVYPLYGLSNISKKSALAWSDFIQRLNGIRSYPPKSFFKLMQSSGHYFIPHRFGKSIRPSELMTNAGVDISTNLERLPAFSRLFNVPDLFQLTEAYGKLFSYLLTLAMPSNAQVDVFHLTSPLPLRMKNAANIITIHDLIPLMLPQSTGVNLPRYQKMLSASIKNADMVFTVSEHSKKDILSFFDLPEEKVHVTYQSVNIPQHYINLEEEEIARFIKSHFGWNFKEYFIFYSAIEPKKNLARLLQAMMLTKTDYPIVIVGKYGWLYDDVTKLLDQLQNDPTQRQRYRHIKYVPFHYLMSLVKGARGLIFPSLYEGFGLPVLEAMQMGCPVITSNRSSLPEVGGDAAIYVDPLDISGIAAAIDKLASDDELYQQLVLKGYQQAKLFSAERYLARLERGYSLAMK